MTYQIIYLQIHKYRNSNILKAETLSTFVQISANIVTLNNFATYSYYSLLSNKSWSPTRNACAQSSPPILSLNIVLIFQNPDYNFLVSNYFNILAYFYCINYVVYIVKRFCYPHMDILSKKNNFCVKSKRKFRRIKYFGLIHKYTYM